MAVSLLQPSSKARKIHQLTSGPVPRARCRCKCVPSSAVFCVALCKEECNGNGAAGREPSSLPPCVLPFCSLQTAFWLGSRVPGLGPKGSWCVQSPSVRQGAQIQPELCVSSASSSWFDWKHFPKTCEKIKVIKITSLLISIWIWIVTLLLISCNSCRWCRTSDLSLCTGNENVISPCSREMEFAGTSQNCEGSRCFSVSNRTEWADGTFAVAAWRCAVVTCAGGLCDVHHMPCSGCKRAERTQHTGSSKRRELCGRV